MAADADAATVPSISFFLAFIHSFIRSPSRTRDQRPTLLRSLLTNNTNRIA